MTPMQANRKERQVPPQTTPDPETGNQADERPDWLPENFKSPEDLAKSYAEATRKITEQGQTISAMEQNLSDFQEQFESFQQQAQQSQQQYDPSTDPFLASYEQAMETGDYRTALAYQAQLTQAAVQQALNQFSQGQQQQNAPQIEAHYNTVAALADQALGNRYQDWNDYKGKIAEAIQQSPHLVPDEALTSPIATAEALDRVYKQVKYDDLVSGTAQQQQQAAQAAEARRLADLAPNNAGRMMSPTEQEAEWAAIKAAGSKSPWTR